MTENVNHASIGRRFFAAQDQRKGGPDPELCTTDYQATIGGNPPWDLQGHAAFAQAFYAAFSDLCHTVEDELIDGDKVAVRFVMTGKHTGAFFGIPATNRTIKVVANVLMHLKDGRVQKLFGVFDEVGMLRQLGVLPSST